MPTRVDSPRVPASVRLFSPLTNLLLRAGVPQGPNALLTVRGRKTGEPRSTGVTVIEVGGQRWVMGTFGEVNWVRNLRAAGHATLTIGRRRLEVQAVELIGEARTAFFRDILSPYVRRMRVAPALLAILGARDILGDPAKAAEERPVFELRAG